MMTIRLSANPVAVISFRYWQRRFGLDPAVVGKTVNINGVPVTIVGVTPPQFYSGMEVGDSPDLALPMTLAPRLDSSGQNQVGDGSSLELVVADNGADEAGSEPGTGARRTRREFFSRARWRARKPCRNRRPPDAGPRELPRLRVLPGGQGEVYLRQSYEQPLESC